MEQLASAAFGFHVVRTPNDEPEWDLIRPRGRSKRRDTRRPRREHPQ